MTSATLENAISDIGAIWRFGSAFASGLIDRTLHLGAFRIGKGAQADLKFILAQLEATALDISDQFHQHISYGTQSQYLEYADVVWDNCTQQQINELEKNTDWSGKDRFRNHKTGCNWLTL